MSARLPFGVVLSMVAVVPQAPLLMPELAAGAAVETAGLRAACTAVATRLAAAAPRWVALGAHPGGLVQRWASRGSFVGFGVDRTVALTPDSSDPADPDLPLPLLIAALLREVDPTVSVRAALVAPTLPTADCISAGRRLAAELAADPEPLGVLVLGDGATTHGERAPGSLDPRAGPFDEQVAAALAGADPDALLDLDPDVARQLGAIGRAPWQVLAGAAQASGGLRGELLYSAAPYGVAYHVALWTPSS